MSRGDSKLRRVTVVGARFAALDIEEQALAPAGVVITRSAGLTADELARDCAGASVLLAAAHPKFTREVLARLAGVRAIVRYGVGVDNIDLVAASQFRVLVCNVPDFGIEEVAIHTVALALALTRRVVKASSDTRAGLWDLGRLRPMHSPAAMVVGVVGLGRIGRAAARHLGSLGFRTHGYDPFGKIGELGSETIVMRDSLVELLGEVDLLTLHVPVNAQTRGLLNQESLKRLKPGAFIVNTSRGELIDESALRDALDSGHVGGAALDVLSTEPPPIDHPLIRHPAVIVTPHAAWSTVESETRVRQMAAEEAGRLLDGRTPLNAVNMS